MRGKRIVASALALCIGLTGTALAAEPESNSIKAHWGVAITDAAKSSTVSMEERGYGEGSVLFDTFMDWWNGLEQGFEVYIDDDLDSSYTTDDSNASEDDGKFSLSQCYPKTKEVIGVLYGSDYTINNDLTVGRIITIQHSYNRTVTDITFNGAITVQKDGKLTIERGNGTLITNTPELTFAKPITVNGELELIGGRANGTNPHIVKYTGTDGSFLTVAEGGKATIYSYQIEQSDSSDPLIVANGEVDFSVTAKNDLPSQIEASGTIIAVGKNGSAKIGGGSFSTSSSTDAAITVADGGKLEISESVLGGSFSDVAPTITAQGAAAAIEVNDGATLTLNGGEITATASGTPAIQVASGGTVEIPTDSKAVVTASDNSAQAIDLADGATVKKGDAKVTVENGEGDNYVDNYGNIVLAAAPSEDDENAVTAGKVILADGTTIEGTKDAPLQVTYTEAEGEDGETVTKVTVPANGSVQKPGDSEPSVLPGGGTVDSNSDTITVNVSGVSLDAASKTLSIGDTVTLTANVEPSSASSTTVDWTSSDTNVATVDENGKVTAVGYGTATITATVGGKTAQCVVNVPYPYIPPVVPTDTVTTTTTNPDGSTTTTVVNKTTGTVTETTRYPDGSSLVVVTESNGAVTTTETTVEKVVVKTVDEPGRDVTATVTIPASIGTATVTIPADVTPGTVAVYAKTGEVVMLSIPTEDGVRVKLDGSAELVLRDNSARFIDVTRHWAKDAVDFVSAHELFNGTGEAIFSPDAPMTRAMLMTVLARFEGVDTTGGSVWYEKGMNWAMANGISDGTNPGNNITREQMAAMLYRYVGSPAVTGSIDRFPDAGKVSPYAVDAMRWAVSIGLFSGDDAGMLNPQHDATRAEVATILMRFCANVVK